MLDQKWIQQAQHRQESVRCITATKRGNIKMKLASTTNGNSSFSLETYSFKVLLRTNNFGPLERLDFDRILQMKTSTTAYLALLIISFGTINGEVKICLKLRRTYDLQNSDNSIEIGELLETTDKELENAIKKSKFGHASSSNYTYFHLYMSHPAVTLNGSLTNGSVIIDDQNTRILTFVSDGLELFNLTFPSIYINGSYDLDGYVGQRLFDIYGSGDFYLQMINFSISAVASLEINNSALCIPVTVKVYLKDFKSYFVNLMNGDEDLDPLINGVIQSIVPDAIETIFREDADFVDPYIQWIIDKILNNLNLLESLTRLLHMMSTDTDLLKLVKELQQKGGIGNWKNVLETFA